MTNSHVVPVVPSAGQPARREPGHLRCFVERGSSGLVQDAGDPPLESPGAPLRRRLPPQQAIRSVPMRGRVTSIPRRPAEPLWAARRLRRSWLRDHLRSSARSSPSSCWSSGSPATKANGRLGEVQGLESSLNAAVNKIVSLDRRLQRQQPGPVALGLPARPCRSRKCRVGSTHTVILVVTEPAGTTRTAITAPTTS